MDKHLPPQVGSRRLRVIQAYQDKSRPSAFILQVNDPRLVHFSYHRYLVNEFRHNFGFRGSPLQLIFTRASGKSNKRAVKT
jgi:GTP-binding protein